LDAFVQQLLALSAPIAGERVLLEKSFLRQCWPANKAKCDSANNQRRDKTGPQENLLGPNAGSEPRRANRRQAVSRRRRQQAHARLSWCSLPYAERAIGSRRTEEASRDAHHCRGENQVVRTTSDGLLLLDKRLIFPAEIELCLDRHRASKPVFVAQRGSEVAHLASGIRVQFDYPFDAIGCDAIARRGLETPVGKPGLGHVDSDEA